MAGRLCGEVGGCTDPGVPPSLLLSADELVDADDTGCVPGTLTEGSGVVVPELQAAVPAIIATPTQSGRQGHDRR